MDETTSWISNQNHLRLYCGRSMGGTLRPGDILDVAPISLNGIVPGDIVVYNCSNAKGKIKEFVHRAVFILNDGIVTRGDNNPSNDAYLVTRDNLVGVVTHIERNGRIWPVQGGKIGLLRACMCWSLCSPNGLLRLIFGAPYRALRRSSAVRTWLGRRFVGRLHTVRLETPQGPLVKTLWRGRVVARWQPAQRRFECRKPFDLFLDPPG